MQNILFICAHSDDHIFGAGGTIAKYRQDGKHVHVIILSYGEKTHPWLKPRYAKEQRARETMLADKECGCTSAFFDLREGKYMKDYPEIKDQLLKIIKKEKPVKIFTHNNEDPHPDHRACYKITMDLVHTARIKPEIYLFSIWNPFSLFKSDVPTMFVDITDVHQKKWDAIAEFKSQWAALTLLLWSIFTKEVKNGLHIGTKFAERFYRIR